MGVVSREVEPRAFADSYAAETKVLNQAVRRNLARLPADIMFRLTKGELENRRSQFVTSNPAAKAATRQRGGQKSNLGIDSQSVKIVRTPEKPAFGTH